MKTVLLHGLGQTAQDWKEVVQQLICTKHDCRDIKQLNTQNLTPKLGLYPDVDQ